MRKYLVMIVLSLFIGMACAPKVPDVKKIKETVNELKIENHPDDKMVEIVWEGLPEELPYGMDGINIYLSDDPGLKDKKAEEAEDYLLNEKPITQDGSLTVENLENGTKYYVQFRAVVQGDPLDEGSDLHAFYPRPTGTMGLSWGTVILVLANQDAFGFDRTTGYPTVYEATEENKENIDFVTEWKDGEITIKAAKEKWTDARDAYIRDPGVLAEEWYEHIEGASDVGEYSSSLDATTGKVYEIATDDNYYGKIVVDSTKEEGGVQKAWVRWAFQPKQGVAGY